VGRRRKFKSIRCDVTPSSREFHPSPSQNSGLEPLDSSGSCHPMRAAASVKTGGLLLLPVGHYGSTWIAALRSTDITRFNTTTGHPPSASHPYARPRGSIHLWLSPFHRCQGSHVPYARSSRFRHLYAGCARRKQVPPELVPQSSNYRGFDIVLVLFDTITVVPFGPLLEAI